MKKHCFKINFFAKWIDFLMCVSPSLGINAKLKIRRGASATLCRLPRCSIRSASWPHWSVSIKHMRRYLSTWPADI